MRPPSLIGRDYAPALFAKLCVTARSGLPLSSARNNALFPLAYRVTGIEVALSCSTRSQQRSRHPTRPESFSRIWSRVGDE
jgi:hypothetical protein